MIRCRYFTRGNGEILADGVDQNCDLVDDCFVDLDGDGFGTPAVMFGTVLTSSNPEETTEDSCASEYIPAEDAFVSAYDTDCDDAVDTTHPGAAELDDPDGLLCMSDSDGDGYGSDTENEAFVVGSDCDDSSVEYSPIAPDPAADGLDGNCDGVDLCYYDADGDGIGQNLSYTDATGFDATTTDCSGPNESPFNTDCNDNPALDGAEVYPEATLSVEQVGNGVLLDSSCASNVPFSQQPTHCIPIEAAPELCDGRDNDCSLDIHNPLVFDGIPADEKDNDSDGHVECSIDGGGWDGAITTGFTTMLGDDCVDTDATIYPLAAELCDGLDNDCDSSVPSDEIDNDIDGHVECSIDVGGWDGSITNGFTAMLGDDCEDTDATMYPLAAELCDGLDNDCDSSVPGDEIDDDSDGHVGGIDGGGWDEASPVALARCWELIVWTRMQRFIRLPPSFAMVRTTIVPMVFPATRSTMIPMVM